MYYHIQCPHLTLAAVEAQNGIEAPACMYGCVRLFTAQGHWTKRAGGCWEPKGFPLIAHLHPDWPQGHPHSCFLIGHQGHPAGCFLVSHTLLQFAPCLLSSPLPSPSCYSLLFILQLDSSSFIPRFDWGRGLRSLMSLSQALGNCMKMKS